MSDLTEREVGMILTTLEDHGKILQEIRTQVRATNGRVTALEAWKARAMGIVAVVLLVGPQLLK